MAEETQYIADTGMVTIATANANLDGTGTLGSVLTGASNGSLIKSISIKAQGNTSEGMIRLFIDNLTTVHLLMEIPVPESRPSGVSPSFETQLILNMTLQSGHILKASTQNGDSFNIIAEGMKWSYYAPSVRPDTTQLTGINFSSTVSVANPNRDGTGTLVQVFDAGTSPFKGGSVRSITIKSLAAVSPGMIRIFVQNSVGSKFLLTEIEVDAESRAATTEAFERTVLFDDDLDLASDFKLMASTEIAETFIITVEGTSWNYAA